MIAIIALLIGLLLPSLRHGRESARTTVCLANQRSLGAAWMMYADANKGRVMPLAEQGGSQITYWWGAVVWDTSGQGRVDRELAPLAVFLTSGFGERSVFECPAQAWGTYRAQPTSMPSAPPTSTYGYNGYYLCPPMTPGWSATIGGQKWKSVSDIERPSELLVFADTLMAGSPPINNALLDPPMLWDGTSWARNESPTTCFRHLSCTAGARADGGARVDKSEPAWLVSPHLRIGSVGVANDPRYVPDWRRWR